MIRIEYLSTLALLAFSWFGTPVDLAHTTATPTPESSWSTLRFPTPDYKAYSLRFVNHTSTLCQVRNDGQFERGSDYRESSCGAYLAAVEAMVNGSWPYSTTAWICWLADPCGQTSACPR